MGRDSAHGTAAAGLTATADLRAALETRLPATLLVFRIRDLERIAWREGRSAACSLERETTRAFIEAGARALRRNDILAHDPESEDFAVALLGKTRATGKKVLPVDARSTATRLASAVSDATGLRVETGWTAVTELDRAREISDLIGSALERGARERERYAFFSTIGHELRTPLTSIRGYLETMLEEDLDKATCRRFLMISKIETLRLQRLVDGMFEISLFDLGGEMARSGNSLLRPVVDGALNAVERGALIDGATLRIRDSQDCRVAISADRLTQIVINLIDNSVKHGRRGGIVEIGFGPIDDRFAAITIDDDGPGIAPQEREAVFSLAKRGGRCGAGTGIGLAVVRLYLERAGGDVAVEEGILGGARFTVRVPRVACSGEVGI